MLGVPFSAHEAGLSDTVLSGSAKVDLKQSCMKSFEEPTLSVNIIIPYSQFYSAPISMYKKIEQYKLTLCGRRKSDCPCPGWSLLQVEET